MPVFRRQKNNGKKDLEKTNYISQEMLLDFVFNVISEVNYSLIKYDVEVKCMDFKVIDDEWFDLDIIDSNNATLGMKIRIAGMSPKALQKKQEAVSSVISASYNDLYKLLISYRKLFKKYLRKDDDVTSWVNESCSSAYSSINEIRMTLNCEDPDINSIENEITKIEEEIENIEAVIGDISTELFSDSEESK